MGVLGMLLHCYNNELGTEVDLFEISKEQGGIELVVQFESFIVQVLRHVAIYIKASDPSWIAVAHLGGEYYMLNELIINFCKTLHQHNISPVFFSSGSSGSDPIQYKAKLESKKVLHENNCKFLEGLKYYLKNFCDVDDIGPSSPTYLAFNQAKSTLEKYLPKYGGKFIVCKGEVNDIMTKYLSESKAFAILGSDGDFCVMKGCRFIPGEFFMWKVVLLRNKEDRCLLAKVITPDDVAASLGLSSQQRLVDLAIISGNDFTVPYLDKIWETPKQFKHKVKWFIENVGEKSLEDCAQLSAILDKNPDLYKAVKYSRRFYNIEDTERYTNEKEYTSLKKYIVQNMQKLKIPSVCLAWYEGQYFEPLLIEDNMMPSMEDWCKGLYCFLYSICTNHPTITVISRSNKLNLDEQEINLRPFNWLPKAHEVAKLDDDSRWNLFNRIMGHLESPVEELEMEEIYNGTALHHFFTDYGVKTGFILHAINYLMTLTYVNKYDQIHTWEYVAVLASALHCVSANKDMSTFKPTWKKPTMQCITLCNWYQYIVKAVYLLSNVLLISEDFPEPHEVYHGRYFTSLYMTLRNEKDRTTNYVKHIRQDVLETLNYIVQQNLVFDDATKLQVKKELGFVVEEKEEKISIQGDLPIDAHKERILDHIQKYRVTCIEGETGSGKSTKVPQFIMQQYDEQRSRGEQVTYPQIIVTQPRRLAAKTLAERVSREVGDAAVGNRVGYKVGKEYVISQRTQITYVTTGYMIELLVHNPEKFNTFTHVILDEIHERDIDADLMSLIVHLLMKRYAHPKIVIMSATLEAKLFLRYFAESSSVAASLQQHLFVGVKTPYDVEDLYLEDLIDHYSNSISFSDQSNILRLFCELYNISIAQLVTMKLDGEESHENCGFVKMREVAATLINTDYIKNKDISYVHKGRMSLDKSISLSVPLVKALAAPGQSVLLFLPGKREIEEIHDMLVPYENYKHADWFCDIILFILHSTIPFEDQQQCFTLPPPNKCHVILATNIAESSLTLPKVTVVIDFGMRRQMVYDHKKRVRCLRTGWCSKASMMQRRGRTGRVCDGICIRIMSRHHYEEQPPFDEPQMKVAPLDKLILQVKYVGKSISPNERPSELLAQAVEPPNLDSIGVAVTNLADIGALTAADECANVTLLGELAIKLPLDLHLCKVILFGCLYNCPCDAIVMAAAMQSDDPFKQPVKKVMKDQEKFIRAQRQSFCSRRDFDEGNYSEPIMFRNLYRRWVQYLSEPHAYQQARYNRRFDGYSAGDDSKRKREQFCDENAIMFKRFCVLEGFVTDLTGTVMKCLDENSTNFKKLEAFLNHMPKARQRNNVFSFRPDRNVSIETPSFYRLFDLFCTDTLLLNTILAAGLTPRFIYGSVQEITEKIKKKNKIVKYNKTAELEADMVDAGVDPKKSICISFDEPPPGLLEEEKTLRELVQSISLMDKSMHPSKRSYFKRENDYVIKDFRIVPSGEDELFVEYLHIPTIFDKKRDPRREITLDLHFYLHYPYQFSEATSRGIFLMDLPKSYIRAKKMEKTSIGVDLPENPYRIDWSLMSADGNPLRKGNKLCQSICSWRNPVGFSCDLKKRQHFGVTATFTKSMYAQIGWTDGVSLFPCYQDNLYAIILMLAFLPTQHGMTFTVNTKEMRIEKIRMFGYTIPVSRTFPLSLGMIEFINEVRSEVSAVFMNEDATIRKQIPESRLIQIYHRILDEMALKDPVRPSHIVQAQIYESRRRLNTNLTLPPTNASHNVDEVREVAATESDEANTPNANEIPESLPEVISVNAFNASQPPIKFKHKENWKNQNDLINQISDGQAFEYLVPFDTKVFNREYLCQYHKRQEELLDLDGSETDTSDRSESETDSDTSEESESDSSDDNHKEYISTYSHKHPMMLLSNIKSKTISCVSQQSVPSLVTELWENVQDIVSEMNKIVTGKEYEYSDFRWWIKTTFVIARLNSEDEVVCSRENMMGKTLVRLIKGKKDNPSEESILTSVYSYLLEKKNKPCRVAYLVKYLKAPLRELVETDSERKDKLDELLSGCGYVFELEVLEDGKSKVSIKPDVYIKIQQNVMKDDVTVKVMMEKLIAAKKQEKSNPKLTLPQTAEIKETVFTHLVNNENRSIHFKDLMSIGKIYETVTTSKGQVINVDFGKVFAPIKNEQTWFVVCENTVKLTNAVYESNRPQNSKAETDEMAIDVIATEKDEEEDDIIEDYEFLSDDVVDLCMEVVEDILTQVVDKQSSSTVDTCRKVNGYGKQQVSIESNACHGSFNDNKVGDVVGDGDRQNLNTPCKEVSTINTAAAVTLQSSFHDNVPSAAVGCTNIDRIGKNKLESDSTYTSCEQSFDTSDVQTTHEIADEDLQSNLAGFNHVTTVASSSSRIDHHHMAQNAATADSIGIKLDGVVDTVTDKNPVAADYIGTILDGVGDTIRDKNPVTADNIATKFDAVGDTVKPKTYNKISKMTPEEERLYALIKKILLDTQGDVTATELMQLDSVNDLWNKVKKQYKYFAFDDFFKRNFENEKDNIITKYVGGNIGYRDESDHQRGHGKYSASISLGHIPAHTLPTDPVPKNIRTEAERTLIDHIIENFMKRQVSKLPLSNLLSDECKWKKVKSEGVYKKLLPFIQMCDSFTVRGDKVECKEATSALMKMNVSTCSGSAKSRPQDILASKPEVKSAETSNSCNQFPNERKKGSQTTAKETASNNLTVSQVLHIDHEKIETPLFWHSELERHLIAIIVNRFSKKKVCEMSITAILSSTEVARKWTDVIKEGKYKKFGRFVQNCEEFTISGSLIKYNKQDTRLGKSSSLPCISSVNISNSKDRSSQYLSINEQVVRTQKSLDIKPEQKDGFSKSSSSKSSNLVPRKHASTGKTTKAEIDLITTIIQTFKEKHVTKLPISSISSTSKIIEKWIAVKQEGKYKKITKFLQTCEEFSVSATDVKYKVVKKDAVRNSDPKPAITISPNKISDASLTLNSMRSAVDIFCTSRNMKVVQTTVVKRDCCYFCSVTLGSNTIAEAEGPSIETALISALSESLKWLEQTFA